MKSTTERTKAERLFLIITKWPKTILAFGGIVIFAMATFLPQLTKDTSAEAFIPPDHPSIIASNKVEEIFGLSSPIVVAIINEEPSGIFNPHSLRLVSWLTERISELDGVDPERVTSLATANDIIGTKDGMVVEPFFEDLPETQQETDKIREAVMDFPLYLGSLVAEDGSATLIVAEVLDEEKGGDVYKAILGLVEEAPVRNEEIHVAGEGAVTEYLGIYITADALRLNPIVGLIITAILFIAYRTLRGVMLPNLVVLGTVVVALGGMAAAGVPFYVITNALPVILIAISVADAIHILGEYYEEMARQPHASQREIVVSAMTEMWRPVTITSLTDIAGFLAIAFASFMPPMKAFGIFASLGILAALFFSLFVFPAMLVLLAPKPSRAFSAHGVSGTRGGVDRFGLVMGKLGHWVVLRPRWILVVAGAVIVAGFVGASRLEVNAAGIENFKHSEPIYQADQAINRTLDGTNYLYVVVETSEPEDIFNSEYLRRIEAMQVFFETLPHVKGTTSIVDFLKQMNRAMHEDRREAYRLPDDADLVAQYFLLYSASGDPTDFEEYVDYDYRLANVRVTMDSGLFTDVKVVVEAGERYIRDEFNAPGIRASLAGPVNVDYHLIKQLAPSHFRGMLLALVAVWLVASLSFRSAAAGALTVVPVSMAVLFIYAVMGFTGIWLDVGTSMFAAIAIGTGVDFAVHTMDRLIVLVRHEGRPLDEAFSTLYKSTGRALLFNFSAVLLGFGVMVTSQVPPLIVFGSLVSVAISVSFLASLTVLPALVKVLQPAFLGIEQEPVRSPVDRIPALETTH